MEHKEIGMIGNYYGCLNVKKEGDKYYWSIEDYNGHEWHEIPEYLYKALIKYQDELDNK